MVCALVEFYTSKDGAIERDVMSLMTKLVCRSNGMKLGFEKLEPRELGTRSEVLKHAKWLECGPALGYCSVVEL